MWWGRALPLNYSAKSFTSTKRQSNQSCSKKQMVVAIICLGALTLLVLIFESHWTNEAGHHHSHHSYKNTSQGGCWLTEEFEIVKDCASCTDFEFASKSVPSCIATGFKETLHCSISGKVFRSCDRVTWIDERNFWTFEVLMILAGTFSYFVSYSRQKLLDLEMLERIQRQLARGV